VATPAIGGLQHREDSYRFLRLMEGSNADFCGLFAVDRQFVYKGFTG